MFGFFGLFWLVGSFGGVLGCFFNWLHSPNVVELRFISIPNKQALCPKTNSPK